jgi:hypothetical protein
VGIGIPFSFVHFQKICECLKKITKYQFDFTSKQTIFFRSSSSEAQTLAGLRT